MICLLFLQSEVKRVLELVEKIFDNIIVLRINGILGFVLLFAFVCYFFSREGRDERGKKIIATAALTSFFALFILLNMILSILVYTFFSRMFDLMLPPVAKHSIVVA